MDPVKDIVSRVMSDLSQGKETIQKKIVSLWPEICDQKTKKHTAVAGLDKGELIVNVDSPAWLFQLNLHKNKLLNLIKNQIPEISGIRFRIGKVK